MCVPLARFSIPKDKLKYVHLTTDLFLSLSSSLSCIFVVVAVFVLLCYRCMLLKTYKTVQQQINSNERVGEEERENQQVGLQEHNFRVDIGLASERVTQWRVGGTGHSLFCNTVPPLSVRL